MTSIQKTSKLADDLTTTRATRGLSNAVTTHGLVWTGVAMLAVAKVEVSPTLTEALASVSLIHAIYLVWIANAVLLMFLGARIFPALPVWVGLMFCTVGAALIVGWVPALGIVGSIGAVLLALRLRRAAIVAAAVSRRLAQIDAGTPA
jgi:hypothetical protein